MGTKGYTGQGRWRDQWWAVGLLVLVIGVAVRLAFRGWSAWPEALAGGVFYAGLLTWFLMRRRRRDAQAVGTEPDRVPELERRIAKNGELPDDPAEQAAMVRLIRRREEKLRRSRRWAFPLLGVIVLGAPLLRFTSGDVPAGLWTLGFGVAFMSWMIWFNRRFVRRMVAMRRRIEGVGGVGTGGIEGVGGRA
ncbi:hypothetical protein [Streptomyces sindenensis]|uniref:hypothetical protein n=1 Tax=Streptomyces sindenensis TaxID=67363 RepID=UPI001671CCD6|nr:hypothetical protein [Streptomyces sindenensis]GGP39230.1 membrane protein [Streptomyces sindenensis]